jgi:hypothetical protein
VSWHDSLAWKVHDSDTDVPDDPSNDANDSPGDDALDSRLDSFGTHPLFVRELYASFKYVRNA